MKAAKHGFFISNQCRRDSWERDIGIRFFLIGLAFLISLSGCTGLTGGSDAGPETIIIRNLSGVGIETVTLKGPSNDLANSRRYGTIAPVPKGVSQIYVRPSSPPRLPERLNIHWKTEDGREYSVIVSLKDALKDISGSRNFALVFEIFPARRVRVITEVQ